VFSLNTPIAYEGWRLTDRVVMLDLSGQPLSSLKRTGKLFWNDIPDEVLDLKSMQTTVGIDLENTTLEGTNWPMVHVLPQIAFDNYRRAVETNTPDLTVIQGNLADYAEAAFRLYENTGRKLLDGKYAKTTTPDSRGILKNKVYEIGDDTPLRIKEDPNNPQYNKYGLRIRSWFTNGRADNSFIVPLLVPKSFAAQRT